MFKPFSEETNGNYTLNDTTLTEVYGTFQAMLWRVLDPGEPEMASVYRNENGTSELSLQFSHFMGLTNWAVYQFIIVILLTNILIAMMNTTFMKVSERADLEWKYSKSYYQAYFLSSFTRMPPPIRCLYYFAKLFRFLKRECCCCQGCESCYRVEPTEEEHKKERESRCKAYMKLLKKLVHTRQHFDAEKNIQDDFIDLRQDIQNMINGKLKNLQKEREDTKDLMNQILSKLS